MLALASVLAMSQPAFAEATTFTTTQHHESPGGTANPCNGEAVVPTLDVINTVDHVTVDDTTGTHLVSQVQITRTGAGSFGNEYVGDLNITIDRQDPRHPGFVVHQSSTMVVIAKGTVP